MSRGALTSFILAIFLVLTGSTQSRALTLTYLNVNPDYISYIPATDGVVTLSFSYLFGPNTSSYGEYYAVEGGFYLCNPGDGNGGISCTPKAYGDPVYYAFCPVDQNCMLSGIYQTPIERHAFDLSIPITLESVYFVSLGGRSLISSTFIFTGPDAVVAPVPVPAALPLFAGSLFVIGYVAKRRKTART